jgi:hypothetical protein
LKINLRTDTRISAKPFITNAGMLSSPTDFEGHSQLMALRTWVRDRCWR